MKKLLLLIVLLSVNFNMFASKKNISLREIDPGRLRELVMKPEVWYDTEEHIIDVTMHSVGVLTVYYADGKSINSDYLYVEFKNLRLWQEVDLYQF